MRQASQALLDTLATHTCEDEAEATSASFIKKVLLEHPDIWLQQCEEGHITGSALIVDRVSKRLLLMHHRKLGYWLQMGGHGEANELDPSLIALREANEESRLTDLTFYPGNYGPALIDVDTHVIPARPHVPEHYHFDFRYLLFTAMPEQAACLESEAKALRWYTFSELTDIHLKPATLRFIHKVERIIH